MSGPSSHLPARPSQDPPSPPSPPPAPLASSPPSNPASAAPRARASRASSSSSASSNLSLKPPRTPRFAEATAVHSPIEPSQTNRSPFADPPGTMTNHYQPQPQPSDVGFGYIADNGVARAPGMPVEEDSLSPMPPKSPLKSALKVPGTPGRQLENPLSPTFREEQILEKREADADKDNARDLKHKIRVRLAKVVLRGVNFSCSLVVLAMVSASFAIFNATKHLPPRNTLPVWAAGTVLWPAILLLVIASISLLFSIIIILAYCRGSGHRRAEKAQVYYTVFATAFFAFSIVMWAVGAGVLNSSKSNNGGRDIWSWSCKDNKRKQLFQKDVDYALVCRLLNWSLICCIIEVVVEVLTIAIYAVIFYRYWSKRRLRKTMDLRDKARQDLYLAQLRSQSAPNTPGLLTPGFGGVPPTPTPHMPTSASAAAGAADPYSAAEKGYSPTTQFATAPPSLAEPRPFKLQPPPIKIHQATPKLPSDGFDSSAAAAAAAAAPAAALAASPPQLLLHAPAAPGEQQYDAVPIPEAYVSPLQSPLFAPMPAAATAPQPQPHYSASPQQQLAAEADPAAAAAASAVSPVSPVSPSSSSFLPGQAITSEARHHYPPPPAAPHPPSQLP